MAARTLKVLLFPLAQWFSVVVQQGDFANLVFSEAFMAWIFRSALAPLRLSKTSRRRSLKCFEIHAFDRRQGVLALRAARPAHPPETTLPAPPVYPST
ncbi:hypothetical protein [Pseudomonas japonica]|uniref:hypothetical protein n=1 Tax=Pseudomonas japonica TaxID=256466 RepID=UPI00113032F5|nr:hypothetical protein [Pseudomonas japonica]